ncbi:MAG: MFS transporter, partial [Mesorhizobium sp.]
MDKRIFWLALGSFAISTEGFVISSLLPDIASDAGISV